jgi:DNA-binding NarL/FixJ family response regulator
VIRVAVADDQALVRGGFSVLLRSAPDIEVVGEAGSAEQAIELANHIALDVAVVDVLMPTMSGISLTSQLFELQPQCRVLGLSVIDEPGLIADMLRAHACGFALKTQPPTEIVDAIRQVLGGLRYLPPGVSRDAIDTELADTRAHPFLRLTPREREVFELIIRGLSKLKFLVTIDPLVTETSEFSAVGLLPAALQGLDTENFLAGGKLLFPRYPAQNV